MRFCEGIAKAKLGLRIVPLTNPTITTGNLPGIPNAHSILMELFCRWNSARDNDTNLMLINGSATDYLVPVYLHASKEISFYSVGDTTTRIASPCSGTKCFHVALLLDRTNNRKKIYDRGFVGANDALILAKDFTAINNIFYVSTAPNNIDRICIVIRLTTLSSVPADIDAAIARMYRRPMVLDASLQAVAVIASQWDFEDVGYGVAAQTVVADHGIVGGYNLSSGATDLRPMLTIVEKP